MAILSKYDLELVWYTLPCFICLDLYFQSFFAGLAASGAITSALRFVTKAIFENSRDGLRKGASRCNDHSCIYDIWNQRTDIYICTTSLVAVLFSSISCFFELLCVLLYAFVFPKLQIVKFYRSKAASEGSLTVAADLAAGGIKGHPYSLVCIWVTEILSIEKHSHSAESMIDWSDRRTSSRTIKQQAVAVSEHGLCCRLIPDICPDIVDFPGFLAEDTGSHSLGSW